MKQEGACSEKGKEVCSEWLSFVSPSSAGTLSSPAGLFSASFVTHVFFEKNF